MTVERLMLDRRYGIRSGRKVIGAQHSQLFSEGVFKWPAGEEPDREAVLAASWAKLVEACERFRDVPDVLRPVFTGQVG